MAIIKYPRTQHLIGSTKSFGDDLEDILFEQIKNNYLVIEEKLDGSQAGISFDNGKMILQSRGHELTGGGRERQFNLFKSWANTRQSDLYDILGNHLIMYGEYLFCKHTEFYNSLPHYFLEFDIFDKNTEQFWSTEKRHNALFGSPVVSVPVLQNGHFNSLDDITKLIGPSLAKNKNWQDDLKKTCQIWNLNYDSVCKETDMTELSEGLYIKVEEDDFVTGRLKYVRPDFFNKIIESGTHWLDRPICPNKLAEGVDIFA